jgi:hypothetical protein
MTTLQLIRRTLLVGAIAFFFGGAIAMHGGARRAGTIAPADEVSSQLNTALSWLPADTETIQVANGPIWMSSFQVAEDDSVHTVTTENVEKAFEGNVMGLFGVGHEILQKNLTGKKILFAMEGSRGFRPPQDLGEAPFDGCLIAIFRDDLAGRRDSFWRDAAQAGAQTEQIAGLRVESFKDKLENDIWTSFVAFPQKNVVVVATDRKFLQEVLSRIAGAAGTRAFAETLPEWKYLDTRSQFWSLRHFDRQPESKDPTSPFARGQAGNAADNGAIGIVFQSDPRKSKAASVTYLSSGTPDLKKIVGDMFPAQGDPEAATALKMQYREIAPGVMRGTYDVSSSNALDYFIFGLMTAMGHAIYL